MSVARGTYLALADCAETEFFSQGIYDVRMEEIISVYCEAEIPKKQARRTMEQHLNSEIETARVGRCLRQTHVYPFNQVAPVNEEQWMRDFANNGGPQNRVDAKLVLAHGGPGCGAVGLHLNQGKGDLIWEEFLRHVVETGGGAIADVLRYVGEGLRAGAITSGRAKLMLRGIPDEIYRKAPAALLSGIPEAIMPPSLKSLRP